MGTTNSRGSRRQHSAELKAKVALAAIKGEHTANEIAAMYGVHPAMIAKWKKQLLEEVSQIFTSRRSAAVRAQEDVTGTLYQEIGRLKIELDWLKKKAETWT
ncbi:MAG: transposase [Candidatus Dormibacteraceae bacterium]